MKKIVSSMFAAGALAALGATVLSSAARAQVVASYQAVLTIQCSIAAEQKALECKEEALKGLEACLAAAEASTAAGGTTTPAPAAVRRCNRDGLAALLKCQLVGLAGDGSCWTNPNPPAAAAGRK